jgi:hypothetical protein
MWADLAIIFERSLIGSDPQLRNASSAVARVLRKVFQYFSGCRIHAAICHFVSSRPPFEVFVEY